MKMWLVVPVLALVVSPVPAAAQRAGRPDSATVARYQTALVALRDTLEHVSARINEFRRDLRGVGEPTVLARSTRLDAACRRARAVLTETRPRLTGALPTASRGARDTLFTAIGALVASLERECERGLGPTGPGNRADTVRAWGPHRTANLAEAINGYHSAAARLARRLGIDLSRR